MRKISLTGSRQAVFFGERDVWDGAPQTARFGTRPFQLIPRSKSQVAGFETAESRIGLRAQTLLATLPRVLSPCWRVPLWLAPNRESKQTHPLVAPLTTKRHAPRNQKGRKLRHPPPPMCVLVCLGWRFETTLLVQTHRASSARTVRRNPHFMKCSCRKHVSRPEHRAQSDSKSLIKLLEGVQEASDLAAVPEAHLCFRQPLPAPHT